MKYLKFFPFYAVSLIPLPVMHLFSSILYVILYYIFKYRKKVVRSNMQRSFPEKSLPEIIQIEKKFFKHFCDIIFESIKALTISKKSMRKRFHINNEEFVQKLFDEKKNVILYAPHFGNWEWGSFFPMFVPHKTLIFYQEVMSKYFDELMLTLRGRAGAEFLKMEQGYKTMLKYQTEGVLTFTCIIGDQSPRKDSAMKWVEFLNQDTAFLIGIDRIANKLNQTVIYPAYKKVKRGYYDLTYVMIEDNPKENTKGDLIEKYAKLLEESIHEMPELWLWSHKRWKRKKVK